VHKNKEELTREMFKTRQKMTSELVIWCFWFKFSVEA